VIPEDCRFLGLVLITISIVEADEAYVIGKRGQYTPVGAYLAGDEIIKIALHHGAQMIHPGRKSEHHENKPI
jgi:pyruvate carboxylase